MLKYLIKKFIFQNRTCTHDKITPELMLNYCPDCGKEVEVYWVILRCKNCNCKRKGYPLIDGIYPEEKYCSKCGSNEFYLEKKNKLALYDYHYGIFLKEESLILNKFEQRIQVWVEEEKRWEVCKPLLLPLLNNIQ